MKLPRKSENYLRRIRRKQLLLEAEGYIELAQLTGSGLLAISLEQRDRLIRRALLALDRLSQWEWPAAAAYLKGVAYQTLERYEEAIIPLREAADLDAGNLSVWISLGWCYKRTDQLSLAIESLEDALEVAPDEAIVHYNLACYWALAHQAERAVEYLANAFEIDENFRCLVDQESDFDSIRNDPDFQALVGTIA